MSEVTRWNSTPEGRREFQQELLILQVTEHICGVMKQEKMSRQQLAEKLGVSRGRVSQMLDGNCNLTLRSIADIYTALDHTIFISSRHISAESPSMECAEFSSDYASLDSKKHRWADDYVISNSAEVLVEIAS